MICMPLTASEGDLTQGANPLTYADLAGLSESANIVAVVKIRSQATLEPARAPGLKPGWARLYIEAETEALLFGRGAIGQQQRYLVDVRLDSRGKPPKLKKQTMVIFANAVPGRPGELRLVSSTAQFPVGQVNQPMVVSILRELADPGAAPQITGVQDAMSVSGNLAGESETQIFVGTQDGGLVSISIVRRPGMPPQWGVSWTEIVDQAALPPRPDTLAWYRLACFLPPALPPSSHLRHDPEAQQMAAADYRVVLDQLGRCHRTI